MLEVVVNGGRVQFEPDPGWQWFGWDGNLEVAVRRRGFDVDGAPVALGRDLEALSTCLEHRRYTTPAFREMPGTTGPATVTVQPDSLSSITGFGGEPLVIRCTEGEFTVTIQDPARAAGTPPPSDPQLVKRGRWRVVASGQERMSSR